MIAMAEKPRSEDKAGQMELALSTVLSHKVFSGRSTLYVHEVADKLEISVPHVISLINEGLLDAIEITGKGNRTSREHWRIPVSGYDKYVIARWNNRDS